MADYIDLNLVDKPYADAHYLTRINAVVSANGGLFAGSHNPVNAANGALSMTLPTGQTQGTEISIEKVDSSNNVITISGNIRGTASQSLSLYWQYETIGMKADANGSWWPQYGHKTKTALDAAYAKKPTGTPTSGSYVDGGTNAWTPLPTSAGGSGGAGVVTGSPMIVNVKDAPYSAKGDNSTNDASAIQAAINAVSTRGNNNSGIVYFPPGTYLSASKLTVPKNVKLVGEGAGTSILLYSGSTDASGYFITFGAAGSINTNGGVERLQVDANLKLGWALLMYGPQEGSALWFSLIRGGTVGGVDCRSQGIEGGNNKFLIASCWIWADGANAMYGAKFDDANGPFAIRDTTFVRTGGGSAPAGSAGVYFNGGYHVLSNVNCEQWESHTSIDAWSNYLGDTLSSYGCTYGITRRAYNGADPAVRVAVQNLTFDSATAYIRDLQQGITIASCKRWSNREIDSAAWNGAHLTVGGQHLWFDSTGALRTKSSQPTSDTDGALIGSGGAGGGGDATLGTAQTFTAQKTFASNTSGGNPTAASIITNWLKINPAGSGNSASLFLDNANGKVFEFYNNSGGGFGVYDKTRNLSVLSINADSLANGLTISSTGAALLGTPTAPTPSLGTNTTQIATAAMVTAAQASVGRLVGTNLQRTALGGASLFEGLLFYATDTQIEWLYTNNTWRAWNSAWISYTPGLTNVTATAVSGRYRYRGGRAMMQFNITMSSVSAGNLLVAAPVAADNTNGAMPVGNCHAGNSGVRYMLTPDFYDANRLQFRYISSTQGVGSIVTNTTPVAFGSGSSLFGSVEYDLP